MVDLENIFDLSHLVGLQLIPIVALFLVASYTDIKDYKIYNWTSGGLGAFTFTYFVVLPLLKREYKLAITQLAGGLLPFVLLLGIGMYFLTPIGGDIKFATAAGIAFGGAHSIVWLLIATVLAGLYSFYAKWYKAQLKVPFAPFMTLGAVVYFVIYYLNITNIIGGF